jgi:hypothetical protein
MHRRAGGTATALGTSLRTASDRPARTATRGDRSWLPGHRWNRPGRTTATPGVGRSRAATRSYWASGPTARSGRTVQGGTRGSWRPAARIARAGRTATRHTRAGRSATRSTSARRTTTRHTRAGRSATRCTSAGRTTTRNAIRPRRAGRARGPVGRCGRTDRGQLRRRLADGAVAWVVRFGAAVRPITAAAVCRPTPHALVSVTTTAEGRTHGASDSPGDRRPGSARRARHRASGRRARSRRGGRRPASAAEAAAVAAGLLRIAGPSPSGGSGVARTHRTVTAPVGLDRGLLARPTEPATGAACRGRRTTLSKGLPDAGAAQPRHAGTQTTEAAQVRLGAGIAGKRSLGGHVTRRRRAGRTASAGRACVGSRLAVVAAIAGRLIALGKGVGVGRPRHAEPGEAAGAFGRPVRCSMA